MSRATNEPTPRAGAYVLYDGAGACAASARPIARLDALEHTDMVTVAPDADLRMLEDGANALDVMRGAIDGLTGITPERRPSASPQLAWLPPEETPRMSGDGYAAIARPAGTAFNVTVSPLPSDVWLSRLSYGARVIASHLRAHARAASRRLAPDGVNGLRIVMRLDDGAGEAGDAVLVVEPSPWGGRVVPCGGWTPFGASLLLAAVERFMDLTGGDVEARPVRERLLLEAHAGPDSGAARVRSGVVAVIRVVGGEPVVDLHDRDAEAVGRARAACAMAAGGLRAAMRGELFE